MHKVNTEVSILKKIIKLQQLVVFGFQITKWGRQKVWEQTLGKKPVKLAHVLILKFSIMPKCIVICNSIPSVTL